MPEAHHWLLDMTGAGPSLPSVQTEGPYCPLLDEPKSLILSREGSRLRSSSSYTFLCWFSFRGVLSLFPLRQ